MVPEVGYYDELPLDNSLTCGIHASRGVQKIAWNDLPGRDS